MQFTLVDQMMKTTGKTFQIDYLGQKILVEVFTKGIYKVNLPSLLFITKTVDFDANPFWTSIPQGRLQEAGQIGAIIETQEETSNKKPQTLF